MKKKKPNHMSYWKIYNRDGWICRYCGIKLTLENRTVDHIIPVSKGGTNKKINLVACCRPCNHRKGNKLISPSLGIGELEEERPVHMVAIQTQWKKKLKIRRREKKMEHEFDWDKAERYRLLLESFPDYDD